MKNKTRLAVFLLWLPTLILSVPALAAWLVNTELAVRVFRPQFSLMSSLLPASVYSVLAHLSLDLSTVSTFVPLLMLLFLLVQSSRIMLRRSSWQTFAAGLDAAPYPQHFGFFLVMLGLAGTLYGLLIGLDISGVSELAGKTPSPDSIRESLDKLLAGTATALLSSLVGLIGAFLAAGPLPWLFRKATGIGIGTTDRNLSATVEQLTLDLQSLSAASRDFTGQLQTESLRGLTDRLDAQQKTIDNIREQTVATVAALASIQTVISETNQRLDRLQSLEEICRAVLEGIETGNSGRDRMLTQTTRTNTLLEQLANGSEESRRELRQQLEKLVETVQQGQESATRGSRAVQRALAAYLAD